MNKPTTLATITNADLDIAVARFLAWKLPSDFAPDAGITFSPGHLTISSPHWPVGTNLLTAEQARNMIQYMLGINSELMADKNTINTSFVRKRSDDLYTRVAALASETAELSDRLHYVFSRLIELRDELELTEKSPCD